jgi:hypothetical protein
MAGTAVAISVFSSAVYEFLKYCLTKGAPDRDFFEKSLKKSFTKARDQFARVQPSVWAGMTLGQGVQLQNRLIECLQSPEIGRDEFLRILEEELEKEGLSKKEAEEFYSRVEDEFEALVNEEAVKNPKVFMAILLNECKKHGVRLDEIENELGARGLVLDAVKNQLDRIEEKIDSALATGQKHRVILPTIQSVLKKNHPDPQLSKGMFFRKEPAWVDFEEGFIVERKEVDEIIGMLEKYRTHLVLGEPAAGKSVVLKNVGFKLAKDNPHVYYVGLKADLDQLKSCFEQILKVKDGQPVLIIDDAHLQLSACERLLRELRSVESEIKVLIGSRPIEGTILKSPRESSEFEYLSKTPLYAECASSRIIRLFLKRKHGFSGERIVKALKELWKYSGDLWILSWALETFDPESNSVDEERIFERIKDSIRGMGPGAEDALLPLSVFYQYEIPIDRSLLIGKMVLEEGVINRLIDQSEIIQVEQLGERQALSLAHSSIAKLYVKAYQNYPNLGENSKKHFPGDYIEYEMFSWYILESDPKDSLSVIGRLVADEDHEHSGRTLLSKLLQNKKIKDQILRGVSKGDNLDVITEMVQLYSHDVKHRRATSTSKSLLDISTQLVDAVLPKLDSETDLMKIGDFFYEFSIRAPEYCDYVASNIDNRVLLRKIEKEKDVLKIGLCIFDISMASIELGLFLMHSLDIDNLTSKLQKEDNMLAVIITIFGVTQLDEELGVDLAKRVDFSKVKDEDLVALFILWELGDSRLQRIISDSNTRLMKEDLGQLRRQIGSWVADHRHFLRVCARVPSGE